MENFISLEKAQSLLLQDCKAVGEELIVLTEALHRVISTDIKAEENIPPFDRSPLDGYAFKAVDSKEASKERPATLQVVEEVPAGYAPAKEVSSGTAIKVMTGAPIPKGADAVIKYEITERNGDYLKIFNAFKSGQNVILAGEDVKAGQVIARKGTLITPPVIGLLASLGITKVPAFKRPKIALISTGDELLEIEEPLKPGKIRNSNRYSLQAYIESIGAEAVIIGTAQDRVEEVAELIEQGLNLADMVITTGGVSVGDYDVVGDALQAVDAENIFWQIDIKPGSPTMAAQKNGKLILGLSGNPASALVVFQLLGLPFIKKMAGRNKYRPDKVEVVLKGDFPKKSPQRRFLRGAFLIEEGKVVVKLTGDQGNVVLRSMIECNVLVEVPAGSETLQEGQRLTAYLVDTINSL